MNLRRKNGFAAIRLFLAAGFLKSNDPEALRMSVECIRVACLSLPFHAVVYNFNNYLMPVKRVGFSCLYSFFILPGGRASRFFVEYIPEGK